MTLVTPVVTPRGITTMQVSSVEKRYSLRVRPRIGVRLRPLSDVGNTEERESAPRIAG